MHFGKWIVASYVTTTLVWGSHHSINLEERLPGRVFRLPSDYFVERSLEEGEIERLLRMEPECSTNSVARFDPNRLERIFTLLDILTMSPIIVSAILVVINAVSPTSAHFYEIAGGLFALGIITDAARLLSLWRESTTQQNFCSVSSTIVRAAGGAVALGFAIYKFLSDSEQLDSNSIGIIAAIAIFSFVISFAKFTFTLADNEISPLLVVVSSEPTVFRERPNIYSAESLSL